MQRRWIAVGVALVIGGCIEGDDPNACAIDDDCSGGRLCSKMSQCERAEDLVDITVHWTFAGVEPSTGAPSRCTEFDSFMVGVRLGKRGFAESFACEPGTAQLTRVPLELTTIGAVGYRNIGNGGVETVDSVEVDRATSTDVTLDF